MILYQRDDEARDKAQTSQLSQQSNQFFAQGFQGVNTRLESGKIKEQYCHTKFNQLQIIVYTTEIYLF